MRYREITRRIFPGSYINAEDTRELIAAGVSDVLSLDIPCQNFEEMYSVGCGRI